VLTASEQEEGGDSSGSGDDKEDVVSGNGSRESVTGVTEEEGEDSPHRFFSETRRREGVDT
jgi:hypothetical protein